VPLNGHWRGSRITTAQGPPVLQGGHQREGLEGGAGLGDGIGRSVAAVNAVNSLPPGASPNLRKALVSIDPKTGGLLALYGGDDYLTSQVNTSTDAIAPAAWVRLAHFRETFLKFWN